MTKKFKVRLNTTLKGEKMFPMGAEFTAPLEELPNDIRQAVESQASYIDVIEVPPEETTGAVPQAKPAADSTKTETKGETTPKPKRAVRAKSRTSTASKPKTSTRKSPRKLQKKE